MKLKFSADKIFWILIIFIGIAYLIYQCHFTLLGDDLTFTKGWNDIQEERGWLAYPTFFYRHWLWSNARFADKINPLFFGILPKIIMQVANSIMIVSLFWITTKLSRLKSKNLFGHLLMLALMVFTLPWWDSLMLNVCWLNYVWSAVLGLSVILLFFKTEQKENLGFPIKLLLFLYVSFSLGMHEASGVPVFVGLASYALFVKRRQNISVCQKIILLAAFVGALYVVSSPASWSRVSTVTDISNERNWIEILLTSNFYLCLLLGLISVIFVRNRSRRVLRELIHSPWIIFVTASVVSSIFSVASGIIGRTGFFSQIYSLIAIFYMCAEFEIEIKRGLRNALSSVFLVGIIVHYVAVVYYQCRIGKELEDVIKQFISSPDGVVYYDYTRDYMLPKYVMNKVKGVPDSDDVWHLYTISLFYSDLEKKLVVLPEILKERDVKDINGIEKFGCDYVSSERLQTAELMTYEEIPLQHFYATIVQTENGCEITYDDEGTEYIVTPFEKDDKELYLISERYVDWGD